MPRTYAALRRGRSGIHPGQVHEVAVPNVDEETRARPGVAFLPLTIARGGRTVPVDGNARIRQGDVATLLCHGDAPAICAWLKGAGWTEVAARATPMQRAVAG